MKIRPGFDPHLMNRATAIIAHGALTNSKRPESFVRGVYPTHLIQGHGSYVWDANNNRYIDFICGLGSNLLGYAQSEITDAITNQARKGACLSLGTKLEIECAESLRNLFPFIERLRFLKSGSDACTAAVIIARAATGRQLVLSDGYHGWHPEFQSLTPPHRGVQFNGDIEPFRFIEQIDSSVAAVIVEPVVTDISAARIETLRRLRQRCTDVGAILIFDEVITGLRFPSYSVSQHYAVTPDLICLGKAIGGGMPLSVVGGSQKLMEEDYFVSSTFAGETLSLAASLKCVELLTLGKFRLMHLWNQGAVFMEAFNEVADGVVKLEGYATRSRFIGDPLNIALFFQESVKAGLLFGPSLFFNFPHIELMDQVLSTVRDVVTRIKTGSVRLKGEMPQRPYAEKIREIPRE